ncbi:MAG: DUF222 domain-containing protein [Actinomycetota bacterium]
MFGSQGFAGVDQSVVDAVAASQPVYVNGVYKPVPTSRQVEVDALDGEIREATANIDAAMYQRLMKIARMESEMLWADWGCRSCAHYLNWRSGIDLWDAGEQVRVAKALSSFPLVSEAFSKGQLSYSKVRAITLVATSETEADLVSLATYSTASQLSKIVRGYRKVQRTEDLTLQNKAFEDRSFKWYSDDDGSVVFKGRLPAVEGAIVVKALEVASEDLRQKSRRELVEQMLSEQAEQAAQQQDPSYDPQAAEAARSEGRNNDSAEQAPGRTSDKQSAVRADALVKMAETLMSSGLAPMSGGDRHQVVIHIDASTLTEDDGGRCNLEDGAALSPDTVRRVCCDSSIVSMLEGPNGEALNIGRKSRSIPPAIRRALRSRDAGCRFPGCPQTKFVDGHHIQHWSRGGETGLTNLLELCRFHHRLVHEGGYSVERESRDVAEFKFRRPDGTYLDPAPPKIEAPPGELSEENRKLGLNIGPYVPLWQGDRLNLNMAIGGLLAKDAVQS